MNLEYYVEIELLNNLIESPLPIEYLKLFSETEIDKYLIKGFEASTIPLSRAAFQKILELLEYSVSNCMNNAQHSNSVVHVTNTEKEALVKQRV